MTAQNIVPFGKYKGRQVEELIETDPAYLQWLAGQDWFRARYVTLHQTIINRGAEPEDTPEHNALQALFLDDEFCLRFLRQLPEPKQRLDGAITALEQGRRREIGSRGNRTIEEYERAKQRFAAVITPENIEIRISRQFEQRGVDVTLSASIIFPQGQRPYHHEALWHPVTDEPLLIEIKPAVGDDYPAVLRQMRRNGSKVLFLEQYTGTGATRDQFLGMFQASGLAVVFRGAC